jgi:hypothetical protein
MAAVWVIKKLEKRISIIRSDLRAKKSESYLRDTLKTKTNWAIKGDSSESNLQSTLSLAITNYSNHTNWFLQHKEMGIKYLIVIVTAELAFAKFFYTTEFPFRLLIIFILFILAFVSIAFMFFALKNCYQSYQAALENVLLITKTLWAMGLTDPVSVDSKKVNFIKSPVWKDETPYVPRYLEDALKHEKTKDFVKYNMDKKNTTYFWARLIIIFFGIIGFFTGIISAGVLIYK